MTSQKSYTEYYLLVVEIARLKSVINTNYRFHILPEPIISMYRKKRQEYKDIVKEKYPEYKYCEKIGGVTFYVN